MPDKILQIITRMIVGGAQETAFIQARAYKEAGCDTLLVTGPETGPEGSLLNKVEEAGIDCMVLPSLRREIDFINDLRAFNALRRVIRDYDPDIVHTHSSKAGILGRLAAASATRPATVHTVHGWGFHDEMPVLRRAGFKAAERIATKFTDRLIAVSDMNVEKGLAAGIGPQHKYTVIHSGVDIEYFRQFTGCGIKIRQEFKVEPDQPLIGTVGRLSPQKSPLEMLEAVKLIADRVPEIKMIMVGDGPLRQAVLEKMSELGLENNVVLAGLRSDVPAFMDAFDVFVLSSRWEGLPRVFAEAMAMTTPVVATNVDGAPQAVVEGANGFLVPVGDTEALCEKVCMLIENVELRRRMGECGASMAARFSTEEMLRQINNVYREVAGTPYS